MSKNVILLGGQKGSGKTTLANHLDNELSRSGKSTKVLSFAYPFKKILTAGGVLTYNQAWGNDANKNSYTKVKASQLPMYLMVKYGWDTEHYLTAREVMQIYGNDLCKMFSPNIWVDNMITEINKINNCDIFIIDDFRFFETETRLPFNVHTVYLTSAEQNDDTHISENSLKASDCELVMRTDKTNPDNIGFNTTTLRNAIKNWYYF